MTRIAILLAALAVACSGDDAREGGASGTDASPADVADATLLTGDTPAGDAGDAGPPPEDAGPVDTGGEDTLAADVGMDAAVDAVEDTADDGPPDAPPPGDAPPTAVDAGPPPCVCDDGNPCTADKCGKETGACVSTPVPVACDDGDPCTAGDVCQDGTCTTGGLAVTCDDGSPCTVDACEPGVGCVTVAGDPGVACDDGDACTTLDACAGGLCAGGAPLDCDDQDVCTKDLCDPLSGCKHLGAAAACDDGNPCTDETCDKETGCHNDPVADGLPCKDGDPCTGGDACLAGTCLAGTGPHECDDGNACTVEGCVTGSGCTAEPAPEGAPCDDGNAGTIDDVCTAGQCAGEKDDCAKQMGKLFPTLKATSLQVGGPGEGVDVDGDGDKDNALAPVNSFVNPNLDDQVTSGDLMYLLHLVGFGPDAPFPAHVFAGALAPAAAGCKFQSEVCDYVLDPAGFDAACNPVATIPGNTWSGTQVLTTEPGTFTLALSLPSGGAFVLTINASRLDLQVTMVAGAVKSFSGVLGGAVLMSELKATLKQIPGLEGIADLLELIVKPDIDLDGNGTAEAVSVGLVVSGIGGHIVGVAE